MQTGAIRLAGRIIRTAAIVALLAGFASGCSGRSEAYGEPVDETAPIPLTDLLADLPANRQASITVSGTIGTICRTSGCWLTLRDLTGEEPVEIFVDLQGAAFTAPTGSERKNAILVGKLVGEEPDLVIHAVGIVVK